ncbi:MAG: thioredoxin family protein [Bacteroidales bacterium]|nr:thioredoxin family protein [Bacteroidales bacterium]
MKKKIIKTVILGIITLALFFVGVRVFQRLDEQRKFEAAIKIFQEFCSFDLKTMDEFCTESLSGKPIMIMFTHPDCPFCHEKTNQLKNRKSEFENVIILMITHADKELAFEFYMQYELSQYENVHFLIDDFLEVSRMYGAPPIPSVFLYGADRQLLFWHKGAVRMDAILKHLPN